LFNLKKINGNISNGYHSEKYIHVYLKNKKISVRSSKILIGQIIETATKLILLGLKYIYMTAHATWLGTGTSIKKRHLYNDKLQE